MSGFGEWQDRLDRVMKRSFPLPRLSGAPCTSASTALYIALGRCTATERDRRRVGSVSRILEQ
jgi:hypothetical protein